VNLGKYPMRLVRTLIQPLDIFPRIPIQISSPSPASPPPQPGAPSRNACMEIIGRCDHHNSWTMPRPPPLVHVVTTGPCKTPLEARKFEREAVHRSVHGASHTARLRDCETAPICEERLHNHCNASSIGPSGGEEVRISTRSRGLLCVEWILSQNQPRRCRLSVLWTAEYSQLCNHFLVVPRFQDSFSRALS
jgi:hypothetical protein